MIVEVVRLVVREGLEAKFEEGIKAAFPFFDAAPGCYGMRVLRSIEEPDVYICLVEWESVSHHVDGFQKSEDYKKLFDLIASALNGGVEATHCDLVGQTAGQPKLGQWMKYV